MNTVLHVLPFLYIALGIACVAVGIRHSKSDFRVIAWLLLPVMVCMAYWGFSLIGWLPA